LISGVQEVFVRRTAVRGKYGQAKEFHYDLPLVDVGKRFEFFE